MDIDGIRQKQEAMRQKMIKKAEESRKEILELALRKRNREKEAMKLFDEEFVKQGQQAQKEQIEQAEKDIGDIFK